MHPKHGSTEAPCEPASRLVVVATHARMCEHAPPRFPPRRTLREGLCALADGRRTARLRAEESRATWIPSANPIENRASDALSGADRKKK